MKIIDERIKNKRAQAWWIWTTWWIRRSRFNHCIISSQPLDQRSKG